MVNKKSFFLLYVLFVSVVLSASSIANAVPRVSIITSVYNGDQFIEGFLYDITQQTIFNQCELIMINANSPGNEEAVIRRYMALYPNIIYKKLDEDPGIYGVWNHAIKMAQSPYITNANLDDRLKYSCYEVHARALDEHKEVDLVYSDFFITHYPNELFLINRHEKIAIMPEFSAINMRKVLPNNHPMWRKSLHEKYGFFDETYRHAGDWQMWLRAVKNGALFLKVPGIYGLYYHNPKGLSTDPNIARIVQEECKVYLSYRHLFSTHNQDI